MLNDTAYDTSPKEYFARYINDIIPVQNRSRELLRSMLCRAFGAEKGRQIYSDFPSLSGSLFCFFPCWVSEYPGVEHRHALTLAEANYLFSIINAIIDPIMDSDQDCRKPLIPLTYVFYSLAERLYMSVAKELDKTLDYYDVALQENMIALAKESILSSNNQITSYDDVKRDTALLMASVELLLPVSARRQVWPIFEEFLVAHKMYDDLLDIREDIELGQPSLLKNALGICMKRNSKDHALGTIDAFLSPIMAEHISVVLLHHESLEKAFLDCDFVSLSNLCGNRCLHIQTIQKTISQFDCALNQVD